MSIIGSNILAGASGQGGFTIEESLRFNASQSSYLSWTPASAGNRKTWTFSAWVKRGQIGSNKVMFSSAVGTTSETHNWFGFAAYATIQDKLVLQNWDGNVIATNAVFRDPSAWYHVVLSVNSTLSTERIKVYVNGIKQSLVNDSTSLNQDFAINSTQAHSLGNSNYLTGSSAFDGYLTEVNFIDGQALDPSSFGHFDSVTGVWKPVEYTGTYGTNGFYLPMQLDNTVEGFNTVTWRGTGSTQQIRGVGFSPDLVWVKNRTSANHHNLFDSVRGAGYMLSSSNTGSELNNTAYFTSLDNDGFSLSLNGGDTNASGSSYVAWCWDAGSSTVSNTDGSITTTLRASPTYGFAVMTYTGNGTDNATIGHGLGSAPKMLIWKPRNATTDWMVWHAGLSGYNYDVRLNTTSAQGTGANPLNNTAPSSSVVTLRNQGDVNGSGTPIVCYAFAEVSGYSKFGSYSGTGASGNVVTTGFKPAFVMVKRTNVSGDSWFIFDNTREPTNPKDYWLAANLSNVETQTEYCDFTDTGFTVNSTIGAFNASGSTYIYMAFKDTREYAYWLDDSGNNNDWQPNGGITTESTVTDTPTPYADGGNYAVLNPLSLTSAGGSLSGGNLTLQTTTGTPHVIATATMAIKTKSYCEFTIASSLGSAVGPMVIDLNQPSTSSSNAVLYIASGTVYTPDANTGYPSFTNGDTIGIAYDPDTKNVWFSKNNTWISGDPVAGTGGFTNSVFGSNVTFAFDDETSSYAATVHANFGQRPFAYTPPTGFKALHTGNLPDSSIVDGSKYFDVNAYAGSSSAQSIVNSGEMQPDFVWIKSRSDTSWHNLFDSVRGIDKQLYSNATNSETTDANLITSLNSNGFSLYANRSDVNANGISYVAWQWKANGTGVSNTDGSITSTVSANPTAGFSIVSYTGDGDATTATIGHGLGVKPAMIIIKNRDSGGNIEWAVYHSSLGATAALNLQTTGAANTWSGWFNDTEPTTTVFTVKRQNWTSIRHIAYCFAEVESYSKFGSYTGNGSADGPFVFTGFRPKYVLFKSSSLSGSSWGIKDGARFPVNVMTGYLFAESSGAEGTATSLDIDFLSNGFKFRGTSSDGNQSGATYIYMAFAENPFKNSLAR